MESIAAKINSLEVRVGEITSMKKQPLLNEISILFYKIYTLYYRLMKRNNEISKHGSCPLSDPIVEQLVQMDISLVCFIHGPNYENLSENQMMVTMSDNRRQTVIKILCRAENYLLYSKKIPHVTRQHFERVKKGNVGDFQSFLAEKLLQKLAKLM